MSKPAFARSAGLVVAGVLVLQVLSCASCNAQSDLRATSQKTSRLAHALIELQVEFAKFTKTNEIPEQFKPKSPQLRIVDGRVLIDAVARNNADRLASDLWALGAVDVSSYDRNVSCFFPIDKLHLLQAVEELEFARPAYAATRSTGSFRRE